MTKRDLCVRTALTLSMATAWGPAFAQRAGAAGGDQPAGAAQTPGGARNAEATPGDNQAGPDEIVVTAQKRTQLLVDVPQSISVVGGETLERQQATNFQDYLKLVPGLQLNQDTPGVGRLVLRGVNTGGVASTVAVYVDETPFGSSSGLVNGSILAGDFDTFDVSRIEVLRGPQGTLYGASSLGGVLKFVTNVPKTNEFAARGLATIETVKGGDIGYSGTAMVNVPLSDTIAIRGSGYYRKLGGFIDSIGTAGSDVAENINDTRSYGGRVSVMFKPTQTFSVRASAYLQNLDTHASSVVESDPDTVRTLYGRLSQSQFVPQFTKVAYRVYNVTADLDLGPATLTSATSYSQLKDSFRTDLTTLYGGLLTAVFGFPVNETFLDQITRQRKFTQELRLAAAPNDSFEWLVGGYYTRETGLISQHIESVVPRTFTPLPGIGPVGDVDVGSLYKEYAGFANGTLHFGERFDLTFGGRYSHNKQSATQIGSGLLGGGALPTARSSENVFTYSVAPKFKLSERASLYARVAKGFRPGGPNILPPGAGADVPRTYKSDSLISYEVGFKGQTDDRIFSVDVAAYHIDWSDIQLFAVVNNFGINANGGKAKIDGAEATLTARPTRGLDLSVNGAYTRARLKNDTDPVIGGLRGDMLPYTPKLSVGVNADYEWALAGETKAFIGGSLRALSKQTADYDSFFRADNGRQRQLRAYQVIDLRAGVDFGRFTAGLYAKNLTDSRGRTSASAPVTASGLMPYPNGASGTGVIRPRTFGVTLGAGF